MLNGGQEREGLLDIQVRTLLATALEVVDSAPAAALILSGAAAEAALLVRLREIADVNVHAGAFNTEIDNRQLDPGHFTKIPVADLGTPEAWRLIQMIQVARIAGCIDQNTAAIADVLREWRNSVHPAVLERDHPDGIGVPIGSAAAGAARLLIAGLGFTVA